MGGLRALRQAPLSGLLAPFALAISNGSSTSIPDVCCAQGAAIPGRRDEQVIIDPLLTFPIRPVRAANIRKLPQTEHDRMMRPQHTFERATANRGWRSSTGGRTQTA